METQTNCSLVLSPELQLLERKVSSSSPRQRICSNSTSVQYQLDFWANLTFSYETLSSQRRVIIIQRGSGSIYCVMVRLYQWAVPGLVPQWILLRRVEERDANTEPEVPSNAGLWFWYSRAVINAGTATEAPYHTAQWMAAVKSCYIMRGGSGGGCIGECWTGRWIKIKYKEAEWRMRVWNLRKL